MVTGKTGGEEKKRLHQALEWPEVAPRFDGAIAGGALWVPSSARIVRNCSEDRGNRKYNVPRKTYPVLRWAEKGGQTKPLGAGVLSAFVNLSPADADQILAFALQWGPLNANKYLKAPDRMAQAYLAHLPRRGKKPHSRYPPSLSGSVERSHPYITLPPRTRDYAPDFLDVLVSGEAWTSDEVIIEFEEPLRDWFTTIRQFRALLLLAHDLRHGNVPSNDTWGEALRLDAPHEFRWEDVIGAWDDKLKSLGGGAFLTPYSNKEEERHAWVHTGQTILGLEISRLLWLAQAHPVLTWGDDLPALTLTGSASASAAKEAEQWEAVCFYLRRLYHDPAWDILNAHTCHAEHGSLFRALVLQLVATIKSGTYRCDHCQSLFPLDGRPLDRKPRFDRSVYCSRSCSTQKHREQDRASYARRAVKKTEGGG